MVDGTKQSEYNLLLIGKKHQYLIEPNRSTIDLTFPYLLPYIVSEFGRNGIVKRLHPFLIMNTFPYHIKKTYIPALMLDIVNIVLRILPCLSVNTSKYKCLHLRKR